MRYKETSKVSILGIIGNIFLLTIKGVIGYISQSQAMIADSLNSAGDIFSSLMTYIGNKIASNPNDENHHFGHGKAEYIFSFLISIAMMYIAVISAISSIQSIYTNNHLIFSNKLLIICIITILTKLFMYLYAKYYYKKNNNLLIKANMNDHRNDIFLTIGTFLAIILSKYKLYYFDGIIGIIISIWILITGLKIFIESFKILMDEAIDDKTKDKIIKQVLKNKEVKNIENIYTIPIGYKYVIVLIINLDGNKTTFESHEIIDKIEKELEKKFKKIERVLIHINPI